MHVVIINGSPRVEKYSNTEKIIDAFSEGLSEMEVEFERYAISDRNIWEKARDAYVNNTKIVIALPLYVECIPGLLLEFLETLPKKDSNTQVSFILQSGFAEASQLRCGEAFLEKLVNYLGVSYGGTLVKGDNFGIRLSSGEALLKQTSPYREMGKVYVSENGFNCEQARKFAGPEYFPLYIRLMLQFIFKTFAKKRFLEAAKSWGADKPLEYRPWNIN
ncbi:MAG: hypothetical protein MJ123_07015 [Lachnospiraceae bacterium]|nr:hypothetical protein [Lachnospiraceae bacterium]